MEKPRKKESEVEQPLLFALPEPDPVEKELTHLRPFATEPDPNEPASADEFARAREALKNGSWRDDGVPPNINELLDLAAQQGRRALRGKPLPTEDNS
jgi:hypothetical protein